MFRYVFNPFKRGKVIIIRFFFYLYINLRYVTVYALCCNDFARQICVRKNLFS